MEDTLLPPPSTATTTTTSSSVTTTIIVTRIATVIAIASISLWANHEASKGIDITVVAAGTSAGRHFDLMYVSNGLAARILHSATLSVERLLFPDDRFPRKHVAHVTLRLATHHLPTGDVSVVPGAGAGDYVISVSPSVMSGPDGAAAVQRGVAKVWLWDGEGSAPAAVVDAVADYLAAVAGGKNATFSVAEGGAPEDACWAGGGGGFVGYCEGRMPGFVARLNKRMRRRWSEAAVDEALGSPERPACAVYRSMVVAGGAADEAELRPAMGGVDLRWDIDTKPDVL